MRNILYIILAALCLVSCGDVDLKQGDVLYLRSKGADMPAYVYGNMSSKTFMILLHGGPGGNGLEYRGGRYVEDLEKEIAVGINVDKVIRVEMDIKKPLIWICC